MTPFQKARYTDPTVNQMVRAGAAPEDIIAELVKQKHRLSEELIELKVICPKRVQLHDGTILVWHCPNELIPLTKL